jgi:hypothetical protein
MSKRLFLVMATVLFIQGAKAQAPRNGSCTLSTLTGAYGFIHDGIVLGSDTHMAEVGVARFDGKGHWRHDATLMNNGEVQHISTRDGTYTVNPDCTGSAELRGSQVFTFDFVILNGGTELMQIATRTDRSVTWGMKRQELDRCSNATIQGSYAALQTGFDLKGNPRAGVGVVTFDGKGAWTLKQTEVYLGGPVLHINNPKGTYSVNTDCTASASLAGTPFGDVNWALAIVRSGEEIFEIRTTPPRGAVTWMLKRQFPR